MSDDTPAPRPPRRRPAAHAAKNAASAVVADAPPEETTAAGPAPAGIAGGDRPGPKVALWMALALTLVQGIHILTSMFQGLALPRKDASGVTLDLWQRVGSGFARFDQVEGLVLLAAVVLVALASLDDVRWGATQARPMAEAILALVTILSAVICIGALLGFRSDLHLIPSKVTPVQRWVLVTYVVAAFGTAGVSLVASLVARRLLPGARHRLRVTAQ